jgi:hypothetical protein
MDTYLTLKDASRLLPLQVLNQLVDMGIIKSSMLATGEILLKQKDIQAQLPREDQPEFKRFAYLAGQGISIREASVRFGIPNPTISRWVKKGYIKVLGHEGRRVFIDLADISYCAGVYLKNPGRGKWIFNQSGNPYNKQT